MSLLLYNSILQELKTTLRLASYYKFREKINNAIFLKLVSDNKILCDEYSANLNHLEYNFAYKNNVKSVCMDLLDNAKNILLMDKSLSEEDKTKLLNYDISLE